MKRFLTLVVLVVAGTATGVVVAANTVMELLENREEATREHR